MCETSPSEHTAEGTVRKGRWAKTHHEAGQKRERPMRGKGRNRCRSQNLAGLAEQVTAQRKMVPLPDEAE